MILKGLCGYVWLTYSLCCICVNESTLKILSLRSALDRHHFMSFQNHIGHKQDTLCNEYFCRKQGRYFGDYSQKPISMAEIPVIEMHSGGTASVSNYSHFMSI